MSKPRSTTQPGPKPADGTSAERRAAAGQSAAALTAAAKAEVLSHALPWLERFHGKTIVIKYGGHAMVDPHLAAEFAADIVFLRLAGLFPVVVHGGGPQINAMLDQLGIEPEFIAGRRVTTPQVLDVVRMVLTGQVQRQLVNLINRHGPRAVGVSGEDGSLFTAEQLRPVVAGERVDVGLVGHITSVRPAIVETMLADGFIPVVSSLSVGADGTLYNVNADDAAAKLAAALAATKLLVLSDVVGICRDWPTTDEVISVLSVDEAAQLLPSLSGGMLPKVQACLDAVRAGVPRAHIVDGREAHSVLLEIFTDGGVGTMICSDEELANSPGNAVGVGAS